jgi:predicted ATPase
VVITLLAALSSRRALLLLDNCDQLVDACARLADALLRRCPEARVLVTADLARFAAVRRFLVLCVRI